MTTPTPAPSAEEADNALTAVIDGQLEEAVIVRAFISSAGQVQKERDEAIADRALYPTPDETRAGFSTDGVCLEGRASDVDRLKKWHHDATARLPCLQQELQNYAEANAALRTRLAEVEAERDALRVQADALNLQSSDRGREIDTLRSRNDRLEGALKAAEKAMGRILPYLHWTVSGESPGHHPTLPSAIGAFSYSLNREVRSALGDSQ